MVAILVHVIVRNMDNFKVAHNFKRRLRNAPNPQNSEVINTHILYTSCPYLHVFYLLVTCYLNTKHTEPTYKARTIKQSTHWRGMIPLYFSALLSKID